MASNTGDKVSTSSWKWKKLILSTGERSHIQSNEIKVCQTWTSMKPDTRVMGQNWDKFLLLTWKNWLLQWRHPIQTLIEVLAPVLFAALLVLIRGLVTPEERPDKLFDPFELDSFDSPSQQLDFELKHLELQLNQRERLVLERF